MRREFKNIFIAGTIITLALGVTIKGSDFNVKCSTKGYGIDKEITGEIPEDRLLVNSENGLDRNYVPEGLDIPNIDFTDESNRESRFVAGIVIEPLEELIDTAKKEGVILLGNSAYRSYKSQKRIYNNRVKSQGKEMTDLYVAKPGYSEHQTGLSIDLTNNDRYFVKGTKEADWLNDNCYRFGFIIRYPEGKEDITGIEYEPWHIRYVGNEAAEYIYENDITLEEYVEMKGKVEE